MITLKEMLEGKVDYKLDINEEIKRVEEVMSIMAPASEEYNSWAKRKAELIAKREKVNDEIDSDGVSVKKKGDTYQVGECKKKESAADLAIDSLVKAAEKDKNSEENKLALKNYVSKYNKYVLDNYETKIVFDTLNKKINDGEIVSTTAIDSFIKTNLEDVYKAVIADLEEKKKLMTQDIELNSDNPNYVSKVKATMKKVEDEVNEKEQTIKNIKKEMANPENLQAGDRVRIASGLYSNDYAIIVKNRGRGAYTLKVEKTGEIIDTGPNTDIVKAEELDVNSLKTYFENINNVKENIKVGDTVNGILVLKVDGTKITGLDDQGKTKTIDYKESLREGFKVGDKVDVFEGQAHISRGKIQQIIGTVASIKDDETGKIIQAKLSQLQKESLKEKQYTVQYQDGTLMKDTGVKFDASNDNDVKQIVKNNFPGYKITNINNLLGMVTLKKESLKEDMKTDLEYMAKAIYKKSFDELNDKEQDVVINRAAFKKAFKQESLRESNPMSDYDDKELNDMAYAIFKKSFQQLDKAQRAKVMNFYQRESLREAQSTLNFDAEINKFKKYDNGSSEFRNIVNEAKQLINSGKISDTISLKHFMKDRLHKLYYKLIEPLTQKRNDLVRQFNSGDTSKMGQLNMQIKKIDDERDKYDKINDEIGKESLQEYFNIESEFKRLNSMTLSQETKDLIISELRALWRNKDFVGKDPIEYIMKQKKL